VGLGGMNHSKHKHPIEPRRTPPGGNDPSPHGSFDLKGCGHLEGGYERLTMGKIEFWNIYGRIFQPYWRFRSLSEKDSTEDEQATGPKTLERIQQSGQER
jgi:hypothetical protein